MESEIHLFLILFKDKDLKLNFTGIKLLRLIPDDNLYCDIISQLKLKRLQADNAVWAILQAHLTREKEHAR